MFFEILAFCKMFFFRFILFRLENYIYYIIVTIINVMIIHEHYMAVCMIFPLFFAKNLISDVFKLAYFMIFQCISFVYSPTLCPSQNPVI